VRYRVVGAGLEDATAWMTEVGQRWDRRLEALQRHFDPGAGADRAGLEKSTVADEGRNR